MRLGGVGCGNVSRQYLTTFQRFPLVKVAACADLDRGRAEALAAEFEVPRVLTVAELLRSSDVELVVNLTVPQAHAEVSLAALEGGRNVYSEKPLATTPEQGRRIVEAARERGVRVGCAPDTFLGGGFQACRQAIDRELIGRPLAAVACMVSHGMEHWHPSPAAFYQDGGGPMLDMGPYLLTHLVCLLGPVRRVTGAARLSQAERQITTGPSRGGRIGVQADTHVTGMVDFVEGPLATVITSFDVWASRLPRLELYGTKGTLAAPDPNGFQGPAGVWLAERGAWMEIPPTHAVPMGRGVGVVEMAHALLEGRPHRRAGSSPTTSWRRSAPSPGPPAPAATSAWRAPAPDRSRSPWACRSARRRPQPAGAPG